MSSPVGYSINYPSGLSGSKGMGYDYLIGRNGVFINSANSFIDATIPIAETEIRGLNPINPTIILTYGKIPAHIFELAINWFMSDFRHEHYAAIIWNDGYHLLFTDQEGKVGFVNYKVAENTIMDLHSHGKGKAFFSGQDNKDEQGFRLSGVVGNLDEAPTMRLRIGIYGYFYEVKAIEIFDGEISIRSVENDL